MYDHLVKQTTLLLLPYSSCEAGSEQYDKLRFGIYVFYINLLKTLVLVAAALLLGIGRYVLVFAAAYGSLRLFSFGIHLQSPFACTLLGLVYYIGGVYLSINMSIRPLVAVLLCIAVFFIFAHYAPAETQKRPIPLYRRRGFKFKALLVLSGLLVCSALLAAKGFGVFSNLLVVAAACQAVNLLPLTYKLLEGGKSQ